MAYRSGFAAATQTLATSTNYGPAKHPIDVLPPLYWKHGDTHIIRFLSDEAIPFPLHEFIPGVDGKVHTFACAAHLDGELRRSCHICNNVKVVPYGKKDELVPARPKPRALLIAVEQDKDRATKRLSDKTREIDLQMDPEDPASVTKVEVPAFGLITAKGDFLDPLNVMYSNFDTTVDRAYSITRGGDKNRPVYTPVPLNSDEFDTPEKLWEKYGLEPDPEYGDPVAARIARWINAHGSVEFYNRYLGLGDATGADDEPDFGDDPDEAPPVTSTRSYADVQAEKASNKETAEKPRATTLADLKASLVGSKS